VATAARSGSLRLSARRRPAASAAGGPVWLFDLDNTLHWASRTALVEVSARMSAYMVRELALSTEEADRLRRQYWLRYGATLLGLVRHHGVDAAHFLADAHELPDLENALTRHACDVAALRRLPGRKLVLTNGPARYARRVLKAIGLDRAFERVLSIEHMRHFGHYRPKPDARMFRVLLARLRVAPSRCILVEDTLEHQKAARALGLRTVWMQRWLRAGGRSSQPAAKGLGEVGVYLHRRPEYVCARISSLQHLRRLP